MRFIKIIGLTLGAGALLYFFFVLSLVFGPDINNFFSRTDFDSEKWKKWEPTVDELSLRWDMVNDLQDAYDLDGMAAAEIVKLLGEPESKSEIEWTYNLGMSRRGIDEGFLSLTIENGRVKSHYVWSG